MLPSKTILEVNRKGCAHMLKAKVKAPLKNKAAHSIEVEETEDDNSPGNTARNVSFNVSIISISPESFHPKKVCSLLCCVQFHFNYGFTEGQEYKKESYLLVLQDHHKQIRQHTRR
jgi:hypothetical protein